MTKADTVNSGAAAGSSPDGLVTREGGDDGGIVFSLKSVCANARAHPAMINITARSNLDGIVLNRRALIDRRPCALFAQFSIYQIQPRV